nr:immunoglobulin heavy chain junction region [Macaca mulatta]
CARLVGGSGYHGIDYW